MNWNTVNGPQGVPTAGDDASFRANNTFVVTVNGDAINNIFSQADLTLNLAGNLTISGAFMQTAAGFLRVTGGGTLSANTITADQFTLGSGATVTGASLSAQAAVVTGANLQSANVVLGSVQIGQGSAVQSTTARLGGFGDSTLDNSTWDVSGQLTADNANSLIIQNGGQLTTGSALTARSGGIVVDGSGAAWNNTGDATIRGSSGQHFGSGVQHGGAATVGGNLFVDSGGFLFLNFADSGGASRLDVSGRVELAAGGLGAGGTVFIGQNATLTSAGLVSTNGFLSVFGAWTNTGVFTTDNTGLEAKNGGILTTSGDLIVGQQTTTNSFQVGDNGTVSNTNGVLAQGAGSVTSASVGTSGTPTAKWTNSGTLTIADAGQANLQIGMGGMVASTAATVGNQGGSRGSVTVRDGGDWKVNGNLTIGAAAMSTGNVFTDTGGKLTVTGATLTLGRDVGSDGTLTLSNLLDHGTQLNFIGDLQVGLAGKGTLNITDGFQLDRGAQALVLGGQATADGTLHVSDPDAQFQPTISTFKSTNLTIGSLGKGTLLIDTTGFVQTTGDAILGEMNGGNGAATVTGPGSKWQVDRNLIVGERGTDPFSPNGAGTVTVADGATLTVNGARLVLGQERGSNGTLVVDGENSTVTGAGVTNLEIGRHGIGTLQLQNHAQFTIASTELGSQNDGAGRIVIAGVAGGRQTMLTVNGTLTVGGSSGGVGGSPPNPSSKGGELVITNGGRVSLQGAGNLIVARDVNSTGLVDIAGMGSTLLLTGPSAIVGQSGAGTLTVSDHANFFSNSLVLGQEADSSGILQVTGSGGANDSTLRVTSLTVGENGFGRIFLTNGAKIDQPSLVVTVGQHNGSVGQVSADGAGSLIHATRLSLGILGGDGLLGVFNGGQVQVDGTLAAGLFASTHGGTIVVTGVSSNLTAGELRLDSAGAGEPVLSVMAGGAVISGPVTLTNETGGNSIVIGGDAAQAATLRATSLNIGGSSTGQATVDVNAGGKIDVSGSAQTIFVNEGGELNVQGSGASVLAHDIAIDRGKFTVSAAGSVNVSETFSVSGGTGRGGPAIATIQDMSSLTVSNSATVDDSTLNVNSGAQVSITDSLQIRNQGAVSVFATGSLAARDVQVGSAASGSGSLTVSDGGNVGAQLLSVTSGSTVNTATGGSITLGAPNGQAAAGTIAVGFNGVLKDNGRVFGDVVIQLGGTVGGSGTINGKLINAGTAAPGDPQTLTVNGDYEQQNGGLLQIAIAGTGLPEFDHLNVTGHITLNSGAKLELDFINGFAPSMGDKFDFLQSGDPLITDNFSEVTITGLEPGFQFTLAPDGVGSFGLVALNNGVSTTVPEPATITFFLAAGVVAVIHHRRRKSPIA
ncbi:MAG: beta strand repeat-containing protein [Chthoniobacterales bacterium]